MHTHTHNTHTHTHTHAHTNTNVHALMPLASFSERLEQNTTERELEPLRVGRLELLRVSLLTTVQLISFMDVMLSHVVILSGRTSSPNVV